MDEAVSKVCPAGRPLEGHMLTGLNRGKGISILDLSYYMFMASVPLEVMGTMYFNLGFSLSVPTGLFFIFSYFLLQNGNKSIHWPWVMNLPLFWLFIALIHYFGSDDFQYIEVLTGIFNNLLFSVILCNYLVHSGKIHDGLFVMGFATAAVAIGILGSQGMDILRGDRFTLLDFDENEFGSILALGALILIIFAQDNYRSLTWTGILLVLAVMLIAAVIASGSRGAMLAFVIAIIIYLLIFFSKKLFRLKTLLIIITIIGAIFYFYQQSSMVQERWQAVFTGSEEEAFSGRGAIYKQSLGMILEKPIIGWRLRDAFLELGLEYRGYGAVGTHNTYLMILIAAGLLGGLPVMIFFLYPFAQLKRQFDNKQFKQVFVLYIFILLVFVSLDWLNRKQMWIFYSMLLAFLRNSHDISIKEQKKVKIMNR